MPERAYRYRFYPTQEQEQLLRPTLGCVRLVYNKALQTRTDAWYKRQERIGYNQTSAMLTQWKKQQELQFLDGFPALSAVESAVTLSSNCRLVLENGLAPNVGGTMTETSTQRKTSWRQDLP